MRGIETIMAEGRKPRRPECRIVRCLCGPDDVVLDESLQRGGMIHFGGVCASCGRGIDLLIEKKPANRVRSR